MPCMGKPGYRHINIGSTHKKYKLPKADDTSSALVFLHSVQIALYADLLIAASVFSGFTGPQQHQYSTCAAIPFCTFYVGHYGFKLGQPAPDGFFQHGCVVFRAVALAVHDTYTPYLVLDARVQKSVQTWAGFVQRCTVQVQAGADWPFAALQVFKQVGPMAVLHEAG